MLKAPKIDVDEQEGIRYTSNVRPRNGEKRTENITIKGPPSLKVRLEDLAAEHSRTLSQVGMLLIQRGLAAYERDGNLSEDQAPARVPIYKAEDEKTTTRRRAGRNAS